MHKENTEDFKTRWRGSHAVVEMVAMMLLRRGFWVQILPQELTPSFEERHQYSDSGDLKIFGFDEELICEVKGSGYEFTDGQRTYDQAFIEEWLSSPQTSLYYSLQVMPDTQDKSDAMAALAEFEEFWLGEEDTVEPQCDCAE